MTLATDLTSVGSTIDLAKANLARLSVTFNSEIAARDATIAQLQAQIAAGGSGGGPVVVPPPTPTITLASSLVTISGTTYAHIQATWNVDGATLSRDGNDAFNSGAYTAPLTVGQRTGGFDFCLSNSLYNVTLKDGAGAVLATNSTTTPTFAAPPSPGTITFTGADGAALPAPFTTWSDAGLPSAVTANNKAEIRSNSMALYVNHISGDQYSRGMIPCTYSNLRVSGTVKASDLGVFSESVLMRHNASSYESGNSTAYIFEVHPKDGQVGFGRRTGSPSVYSVLQFVPFTFVDVGLYYFRYEVQDTTLRFYLGLVPFSGAWTTTYTDNSAGALYGSGSVVEFWNGDHGFSTAGAHTVFFDDCLIEDLGGVAVAPGGGSPGGGATTGAGAHLLGVYSGNSPGDASYFGSLVNHEVKILSGYCDIVYGLPSMFTSGGVTAWLRADSTRRLLLGCNPISGNAGNTGNFEDPAVISRMQQLATAIVGQGIASQVIIRFGYEMNGDWMPWGRQYAGNAHGERFIPMWRNAHAAVNAIFPFEWDWCSVFLGTGPGELADWFYPGDDVVTYIGSDNYDVFAGGDEVSRWGTIRGFLESQTTFAARHHKVPTQDEWACWTPASKQGGGDDRLYVVNMLQYQKDNGFGWGVYFNSSDGGVGMTLTDAPNALSGFRAHVWA